MVINHLQFFTCQIINSYTVSLQAKISVTLPACHYISENSVAFSVLLEQPRHVTRIPSVMCFGPTVDCFEGTNGLYTSCYSLNGGYASMLSRLQFNAPKEIRTGDPNVGARP
jgi:hypothetical protein